LAFWTGDIIERELKESEARDPDAPLVKGWKFGRIMTASYELSLGDEVFVTSSKTGIREVLKPRGQVVIPPGQFALLLTEESLNIPTNVIALISIKTGVKFRGLVNVSGFHVDPGFHGKLKFSVYNAGSESIVLTRGEPLFPIWFSHLFASQHDTRYKGDHQGQQHITANDIMNMQGEVASPAALKLELDTLKSAVSQWKVITIAILTGLLTAVVWPSVREAIRTASSGPARGGAAGPVGQPPLPDPKGP
jgi:dCTP deaminase